MGIRQIIDAIPSRSSEQRARMRANAERALDSGPEARRSEARALLAALDAHAEAEDMALRDRLADAPAETRVIEAFRARPPTATERRLIEVLLDNPGRTSSQLTAAMGWQAQAWHLHFGEMCKARARWLWPAETSGPDDKPFLCGILAEFDPRDATFTMKSEAAAAMVVLGIHRG